MMPSSLRRRCPIAFAVAAVMASTGVSPLRAEPSGDASLDHALAERFALYGDEIAADPNAPEPLLRQAAAMLDLARLYKPREVRFARSSADVLMRLGERDRAIEALTALRQLDARDTLAMIQFVDLNADRMETGEAKAAYLQKIADTSGLAAEVRAHAAASLMNLFFERSQDQEGLRAMSQAISLNPQNLTALRVKYDVAVQSGDPAERAKALAAIVQASPNDPRALLMMSDECAANGDYENAGVYAEMGMSVLNGSGQPPVDAFLDYAAVKLLANSTAAAEQQAAQLLQYVVNDARLYAMQAMLAMANGKPDEEVKGLIDAARGVYLARLAGLSQALNQPENQTPPATRPAVPFPDVRTDAAKLTADNGDPNRLRGPYAIALAEQIWFDAYFRAATIEPSAIEALKSLLGDPNDPLAVRLEGWALLAAGKNDEAMLKFGAIAERDGYAKLGLTLAANAKGDAEKAKQLIGEMLAARPTGLYGATVGLQAKKLGVRAPEMSAAERQIAGLAGSLKNPLQNLLNNPRTAYVLSARPVSISNLYGDPILAEVRLLNTGGQPITIGPGGLVSPRFSIDVNTRGASAKVFPGTVFGQWTGAVRLLPQQQLSQVVRIDRGPAGQFLKAYPTAQMSMSGMITANPYVTQRGSVPLPGGQQSSIGDGFERKASPFHLEAFRKQVDERLSSGSSAERISAAELVGGVVVVLRQPNNGEEAAKVGAAYEAKLDERAAAETNPLVAPFVKLAAASGSKDAATRMPALVTELAGTKVDVAQATAIWWTRGRPADMRKTVAQAALATNPSGPIRELAEGLAAQGDLRPATQPAGERDAGTPAGTGGATAPAAGQ